MEELQLGAECPGAVAPASPSTAVHGLACLECPGERWAPARTDCPGYPVLAGACTSCQGLTLPLPHLMSKAMAKS